MFLFTLVEKYLEKSEKRSNVFLEKFVNRSRIAVATLC